MGNIAYCWKDTRISTKEHTIHPMYPRNSLARINIDIRPDLFYVSDIHQNVTSLHLLTKSAAYRIQWGRSINMTYVYYNYTMCLIQPVDMSYVDVSIYPEKHSVIRVSEPMYRWSHRSISRIYAWLTTSRHKWYIANKLQYTHPILLCIGVWWFSALTSISSSPLSLSLSLL